MQYGNIHHQENKKNLHNLYAYTHMCTYSLLYKNKIFNYIFSISTFHLNSGIYHTYSKLFYVHSSCVPTPPWGNLQGTAAFIYPSANGKITCTNASVNTQGKIVSLEAIITLHLAFHAHIQLLSTRRDSSLWISTWDSDNPNPHTQVCSLLHWQSSTPTASPPSLPFLSMHQHRSCQSKFAS